MEHSADLAEIAAALANAQAGLQPVIKDKTARIPTKNGGAYSYRYADLSSIWGAIRSALTANGIAVVQMPELTDAGMVTLTTMLLHSSGQWVRSSITTRPADTTPQAVGSAITFSRRYALAAMVGVVADEDDDGATATHGQPGTSAPAEQHAPQAPAGAAPVTEVRPATAAQYRYIHGWMKRWTMTEAETITLLREFGIDLASFRGLTGPQASDIISALKASEPAEGEQLDPRSEDEVRAADDRRRR